MTKKNVGGDLKNRRLVLTSFILALTGLVISCLGIPPVYQKTFPGVTIKRVAFDTGLYEKPARKVSGLLILPKSKADRRMPGLVFCHGMTVQKEMYVGQCRELALKGIAVLAVDLRGHGQTGGSYSFGSTEMRDAWSAVDYLSQLDVVDTEKIAVAGHSLGGITATRAGLFQKNNKIKAVVAIYCWPSQKEAIEAVFGNIENFIGKIWPYYSLSRVYDINDRRALAARNVINHITTTKPPNYELIMGKWDTLGTISQAKKIISKSAGIRNLKVSKTYGDFKQGTARRLVVTTDTHLTEAVSSEVISALSEWLFLSFGLKTPPYMRSRTIVRYIGWSMINLGFFLIALASLTLAHALLSKKGFIRTSDPVSISSRSKSLGVISALLFLAVSFASFPFSKISNIRAFLPFFGIDLFASMALSRAVLLLGTFILLLIFSMALRTLSAPNFSKIELKEKLKTALIKMGLSLFVGSLPIAVFMLLYTPTAHALLLPGALPVSAGWFFATAAVLAFQLCVEQIYFHSFLLQAFESTNERRSAAKYILTEGAVRGLGLGMCFLPVVSNPFMLIGHSESILRIPLVPLIVISGFITFSLIAALALFTRSRGYDLAAPSFAIGLYLALVSSSVLSTRAF